MYRLFSSSLAASMAQFTTPEILREEITPLGLHLLDIPLDPWLGKILQHAVMHKCLDPVLIITYSSSLLLSMDLASRREGSKKKEGC